MTYSTIENAVFADVSVGGASAWIDGQEFENAEVFAGSGNDRVEVSMSSDPMKLDRPSYFTVDGGGGTDTLAGINRDNSYRLAGMNAGTLTSLDVRGGTTFTSIENIWAGAFSDTLYVIGAGRLTGTFDGAGGTNDRVVGPDTANTWTLTGTNAGDMNGAVRFVNVESVRGGIAADLFVLGSGFVRLTGTLDGGLGSDTLDARLIAPLVPAIGSILSIEGRR